MLGHIVSLMKNIVVTGSHGKPQPPHYYQAYLAVQNLIQQLLMEVF